MMDSDVCALPPRVFYFPKFCPRLVWKMPFWAASWLLTRWQSQVWPPPWSPPCKQVSAGLSSLCLPSSLHPAQSFAGLGYAQTPVYTEPWVLCFHTPWHWFWVPGIPGSFLVQHVLVNTEHICKKPWSGHKMEREMHKVMRPTPTQGLCCLEADGRDK